MGLTLESSPFERYKSQVRTINTNKELLSTDISLSGEFSATQAQREMVKI